MARTDYKSVTTLFKESSAAVRRNLGVFIILNIVGFLDLAWQLGTNIKDKTNGSPWENIISNGITGGHGPGFMAGSGGLLLILVILGVAFSLMTTILSLQAAKKQTVSFTEVWEEFKTVWFKLLIVVIFSALLIGFSFVLLIIPGLFVLPRLVLAPYVMLDQKLGVMDSLNRSWEITKGHSKIIWLMVLFGLVLALPNVVPFLGPIVAFALGVLYSVAAPLRYLEIKGSK